MGDYVEKKVDPQHIYLNYISKTYNLLSHFETTSYKVKDTRV